MSREQLNQLLDAAVTEAVSLLEQQREFFPFGMGLTDTGGIQVYSAFDGDDQPPSAEVIGHLTQGLRSEAENGNIVASAITYEVNATFDEDIGQQSAICVALEHISADPISCYRPFILEELDIQLGEIVAQKGQSNVFRGVT